MDVGCSQWLLTASNMTPQHQFGFTLPQVYKILPSPAQVYNSVRMHPYAHPQHMKVLKHIVYFQYGCGMQSVMVYSLNHDITTSFALSHTPIFLKSTPHLQRYQHKGAPTICPSTASQGAQTLCIHPIPMWMWDAVNGGLQPQP